MLNPIMMVRKIKNSSQNKLDLLSKCNQKLANTPSDESRPSLSKSFGPAQGSVVLNNSRSSSLLSQKFNQAICSNSTPINKKVRNKTFLCGDTNDLNEAYVSGKNHNEFKSKSLKVLESWLTEALKGHNSKQKPNLLFVALKKLPIYDPNLKKFIEELSNHFEPLLTPCKEDSVITRANTSLEESLNLQITEYKNTISELNREKKVVKKKIDQMNSILKFMNKKGVPVELYFQQYFDESKNKNVKESMFNSIKGLSAEDSKIKLNTVPKLNFMPPSEVGFHQEFMSRVDEFSESWRNMIKNEKSNN